MWKSSLEEAKDFTVFAAENKLTLTNAMKQKWDVNFEEIDEFLNTVMDYNIEFLLKQCKLSAEEVISLLEEKKVSA